VILLALLATNVAALAAALHYRASRDVWRARALDAMGSGRAANRSPASVRADAPAGRAMNHYSSSGSLLDLSHFRPNTQRDMAPPPAPAVVQRPAKRAMPSFDVVADAEASIKGRLPLIRMLLPAKVAEIMALYPDIWPGPNNSTGYRRLVADLRPVQQHDRAGDGRAFADADAIDLQHPVFERDAPETGRGRSRRRRC